MNTFLIFLMCMLSFWSIVFICAAIFGFRYLKKSRDKSVSDFIRKHKIDL